MGLIDNFAKSRGYVKQDDTQVKSAADIVTGGSWGEIFGGYSGGNPSFTSFNSQKEQLQAYVDWVYAATRYIAETCSTIDLRVFKNHTSKSKVALGQKLIYNKNSVEVKKYLTPNKTIIEKGVNGKLITRKNVAPLEELETHPILDLLDCPNPYMTRAEFFEMTFLHLELAGEAFWAVNRNSKNGPPTELWPLMPNLMSVVADEEKFIIGYMYTVGGQQLPFAPEDIIHHKYSNPNDLRRGMSPVQAAARIIDTDSHMADHNRRIFYNGATVDAVLYTENKLTDENWKRLNDQWKDKYSGSANAHKTAILENGLKYQPMALSNRDLNFLEGMNFNRDMILAIFGVPKSLLGMDESMSRANAEAAEYAFSKNKIRPKMLRLTARITEDLAIQFGKDDILVSFTDPVPDDKEFLLKEKQASVGTTSQVGWRTVNEVRAEDGDDPIEGGDELWINQAMVPLGQAAAEPEPEEKPAVAEEDPEAPDNDDSAEDTGDQDNDDGGDSSTSDDTGVNGDSSSSSDSDSNSSAGTGGSTSSPKAVKDMEESDPEEGGDLTPDVKPLPKEPTGLKAPKVLHDTSSKVEDDTKSTAKSQAEMLELHKDYTDKRNAIADKYETDFMQAAKEVFDQQKQEVLRNVQSRFKSYKPAQAVTKAQKKKTDNLFDKAASAAAWASFLVPIYRGAINSAGNAAYNYVSDASTIGTSAQFSGADPAIQAFYTQRTNLVSVGIDDTTDRLLKTSLIEGISAGESVSELADRVEGIYGAAAGYRAQRIARTESIDSTSFATEQAWVQSGVVTGKQWYTDGPNPCPHCLDMNGKIMNLNENFFDKGDSLTVGEGDSAQVMKFGYDNVDGPPLHPNCACTLLPVLAK